MEVYKDEEKYGRIAAMFGGKVLVNEVDLRMEWHSGVASVAAPARVLLGSTHPVVTARGWYM